MLAAELERRRRERGLLLMAHIVIGYPDLPTSLGLVDAMVRAGVDLLELQLPFSEPIADGPVILRANQLALAAGVRVDDCLDFTRTVSARHRLPLLFMTYHNIVFRRGARRFASESRAAGVSGLIVPDLPPGEAGEHVAALDAAGVDPIFMFSPRSSPARMRQIAERARGFIYCVARAGVTGADTEFSAELAGYLARARQATSLPLAVGFGVKARPDVEFLRGKADIAVVGSESLRLFDAGGPEAVGAFLAGLRHAPQPLAPSHRDTSRSAPNGSQR